MNTVATSTGTSLAFAYGRIANLKDALLSENDCNRLLGAKDGKDATAILTELPLTKYIDQGISQSHELLQAVEHWIKYEAFTMTPVDKQNVLHVLWADRIAATLSLALKQKHGFTLSTTMLEDSLAPAECEPWVQYITTGATEQLSEIAQYILCSLPNNLDTAIMIDTLCFAAAAAYKIKEAKRSGSTAITRYIVHTIDCTNILNRLRFGDNLDPAHVLPGGDISLAALTGAKSALLAAMTHTDLSYQLIDAIRNDSTNTIEQLCSSVIKQDLSNLWNTPLSIEPVFAFAAVGMNHVEYARNILIGKLNGLEPQEIKHLVPTFIPASTFA
jgi:hypothetical protein